MPKQSMKITRTFIYYLLLAIPPLLLYGSFFWNPLIFDDEQFFVADHLAEYSQTFSLLNPRWLPYATLSWTKELLGEDLLYFRAGNLILHIANAVLIFIFLRKLFEIALPQRHKNNNTHIWIAFFSAQIFVLHPIASYAAGYLIQRTILMATFFGMLMLISYLIGLTRNNQYWFIASAIFYFLSVFSKENSVMLPGVALAMTFLISRPSLPLIKRISPPFILFTIIAAMITLSVQGKLGTTYESRAIEMLSLIKGYDTFDPELAYLLSMLTQASLFFKYIFLWVLPSPAWVSIDMREPFAVQLGSWPHIIGTIGFVLYPLIGLKLLLKREAIGLAGFAILFPWILFLTEFSTIRIQEPFVLYRSYIWMIGSFAALPFILATINHKKIISMLLIISITLTPLTWNRLESLSHPLLLWHDAVTLAQKNPQALGLERIYHNRGYAYLNLNMFDEAILDFDKVLASNPDFYFSYFSRGRAYYEQKEFPKALNDFNSFIVHNPDSAAGYLARGFTLEALNYYEEAHQSFQIGCILGDEKACKNTHKQKHLINNELNNSATTLAP